MSERYKVVRILIMLTAVLAAAGAQNPDPAYEALEMSPDNFSAHEELAKLAEQRDEFRLAAEHYEKAWRIKPGEPALLLDLGRVWKALGRSEDATSALLAASRGGQPRVSERARE